MQTAIRRRQAKPPLSPAQRRARSQARRDFAVDSAIVAGKVAIAGGIGYSYYRQFTTAGQRSAHRAQMGQWLRSPYIPRNARIAGAHIRGQGRKAILNARAPFTPHAKFNRYYNRRAARQRWGMRMTAAKMNVSNARSYNRYSKGRWGNMVNAPTRGRAGRIRRNYKGQFAGWF